MHRAGGGEGRGGGTDQATHVMSCGGLSVGQVPGFHISSAIISSKYSLYSPLPKQSFPGWFRGPETLGLTVALMFAEPLCISKDGNLYFMECESFTELCPSLHADKVRH